MVSFILSFVLYFFIVKSAESVFLTTVFGHILWKWFELDQWLAIWVTSAYHKNHNNAHDNQQKCNLLPENIPYSICLNGWMHGKWMDKKQVHKPFKTDT